MTENWLTSEMGFRVARRHAFKLRRVAQLCLALPLLALLLAVAAGTGGTALVTVIAAALFLTGAFLERWLFFAEARHTVGLYYGQSHA